MLNIGDFAFDTTTGTNVQVLESVFPVNEGNP